MNCRSSVCIAGAGHSWRCSSYSMHFTWWWNRWRAPKFFYFFFFFFHFFFKKKKTSIEGTGEETRIVHHRQPPRTPVLYTCVHTVIGRERAKQRDCGHKMCPINFKWGEHTAPKEKEEKKKRNDGRRKREKMTNETDHQFLYVVAFFFFFFKFIYIGPRRFIFYIFN